MESASTSRSSDVAPEDFERRRCYHLANPELSLVRRKCRDAGFEVGRHGIAKSCAEHREEGTLLSSLFPPPLPLQYRFRAFHVPALQSMFPGAQMARQPCEYPRQRSQV